MKRRDVLKLAAGTAVTAGVYGQTTVPKPWRIDAHMHLEWAAWRAPTAVRPQRTKPSRQTWIEWVGSVRPQRAAEYRHMVASMKSYEQYVHAFVREMDEAGIATSCINAMDRELEGYYRVPYWDVLKQIAKAKELYPDRFVLFCGMDPHRGQRGLEMLERAVKELGYRGMGEMLRHYHLFLPDDKRVVYPYYRKCLELNILV